MSLTNSQLAQILRVQKKFWNRAQQLLESFKSEDSQSIEQSTNTQLVNIVDYARNNSEWWARYPGFSEIKASQSLSENLSKLPILTRSFLQENFDSMQIKNPNLDQKSLDVYSTSGSTGQPVRVVKHAEVHAHHYQSMTVFDWLLSGRDPKGKILTLKYKGLEQNDVLVRPLQVFGAKAISLIRDPSMISARELLDLIEQEKPKYILGTLAPVKTAAMLALAEGRNLTGIIERLITHADSIHQEDRDLILRVFGAEIDDRYSTEEVGYIALQCPYEQHLHVIAPNMHVEILDEHGKECSPGQMGQIYLTSLRIYTMPLLRYWIGDYGIWGAKCPHTNWPTLLEVVGRVRDTLVDSQGNEFVPVLGNMETLKLSSILQYQVFMLDDAIAFVYRVKQDLTDDFVTELTSQLQHRLRSDLPVVFMRTDAQEWRSEYKKKTFEKIAGSISEYPDADSLLNRKKSLV